MRDFKFRTTRKEEKFISREKELNVLIKDKEAT